LSGELGRRGEGTIQKMGWGELQHTIAAVSRGLWTWTRVSSCYIERDIHHGRNRGTGADVMNNSLIYFYSEVSR
jgi:hypothetical protein